MTLAYVETLRAGIALADGEHDVARASLERAADVIQGSREPQFLGWFGSLRGELERRCGDLAAARAAIDDGLDAIEFCSEDLPRLALLSETGTVIEADAAQRARDLGDETAEREAISRAEGFEMRAEACADDVRPVEVARLETIRAHLARARGKADPALDAAAIEAWRAVARPYPVATAQLRRAETLIEQGERDDAAAQLADVLAAADDLGAPWLRPRSRGSPAAPGCRCRRATRRRRAPEPPGEDPFGLTPRERQVLELVADGATNREIGAQLFMAEKTASVHVSRILAKLDVRSRTEAAAVGASLRPGQLEPPGRRAERRRLREVLEHAVDGVQPLEGHALAVVALDAGAGHAREAALVLLGAVGVDRVLEHDGAEAELEQPDRGLGHAHVGLEADEHDRSAPGGADRVHRLVVGGEAERRLDDHRRVVGQALENARISVVVAQRALLDHDGRNVEQPARPAIQVMRPTALAARTASFSLRPSYAKKPAWASTTTKTLSSRRTSGTARVPARGARCASRRGCARAAARCWCRRASSPRRPPDAGRRSARASRARPRGSSGGPRGRRQPIVCIASRALRSRM